MSGLKWGHGEEGVEKRRKKGSLVVPMDCTLYGAGWGWGVTIGVCCVYLFSFNSWL